MNNTTLATDNLTYALANFPDLPVTIHKLFAIPKGRFVRLTLERSLKVRKGKEEIIKHSECTIRIACEYENLSQVKEIREDGKEKGEMAWGTWMIYPILKEHKGNYYIRATAVPNNDNCVPRTSFTRNGLEISKDEAKADALASEFYEKDLVVFDVKISNIVAINGEAV